MKLEEIKPGMTLWTVLTTDQDGVPIVALINGVVTEAQTETYPHFECAWKYGSQPMTWITFDEEEVYSTPQSAISAYLGWVSDMLTTDLIEITKEEGTRNGYYICPQCKSGNVLDETGIEYDGCGDAHTVYNCEDCGCRWGVLYQLKETSREILKDGKLG